MNLDNILVDTAAHLQEEAFTYQRERRVSHIHFFFHLIFINLAVNQNHTIFIRNTLSHFMFYQSIK